LEAVAGLSQAIGISRKRSCSVPAVVATTLKEKLMLVILLAVCRDDLRFPVTERAASPTSADLLLPLYKAAFIQICVRPGDRRYSALFSVVVMSMLASSF
jgi:hypothetical protein